MVRKIYLSLSFLVLFLTTFFALAEEISAKQVVESFQDQLIEVMKAGKELGFQGRYDKLDKAVKK
jgi:phospholipid transport system substrate-binding protein